MNEKSSGKSHFCFSGFFFLKRRWIILSISVLFFLSMLIAVGMVVISKEIDKNREKIASQLKQDLGFPVTFDKLKTGWFGLSLYISLENVTVFDTQVPIAFIKMNNVKVFPDVKALLFKQELHFEKIILHGLRMVVGCKDGFSILGLQGEAIPTNIDYAALMASLLKQQNIIIKNAEIDWQMKNVNIKHTWQGRFSWISPEGKTWSLKGTQQLQIGDGLILPESDFTLAVSSELKEITFKVESGNTAGECHLVPQSWQVNCQGQSQEIDVLKLRQYYIPKSTDPAFLQWFLNSVPRGIITDSLFKIYGSLNALQWKGEVKFKEADLHYAAGWPPLTELSGLIEIENKKISLELLEGEIMDEPIEALSLVVEPEEKNRAPFIYVNGSLHSSLRKGLLFLQENSKLELVARYLEPLHATGFMHLDLKLKIPLDEKTPVMVNGSVSTKEARLEIPNLDVNLTQLQGDFHFTEQTLAANGVKAYLNEKPLEFAIETNIETQVLQINTKVELNAEFFQKRFHLPDFFKGQSLFALTFKKRLDPTSGVEWLLSSDLKGMAVQLPGLLAKKADGSRLMTLNVDLQPGKKQAKIALRLKDLLDVKLIASDLTGKFKLKRGHAVFGKGTADWTVKEALLVGGEIESLNIDEWLNFFKNGNTNIKPSIPLDVNLLVDKLYIYGLQFNKTWLVTNFLDKPLNWAIDGPFIKGEVILGDANTDQIDINLAYLKVAEFDASSKNTVLFLKEAKKIPVSFYCKHLQYGLKFLGEVSFKLLPKVYGYAIQGLSFKTPISEVQGSGEWYLGVDKPYTVLQGEVFTANMEKTFLDWGYPSAIRDASGYIKYQFKWLKDPFQFHIGAVEGAAELKLDKGRIFGVDPGLGRVMGLLNIESIQRRLQLDFSDLFKKGFVFDILKGKLIFQRGITETQGLLIDGPSAKIELSGKANVEDKAIDLKMTVVPHAEMGLPLAAAIVAGNPMIAAPTAAGIWIVNKLTGSKINNITGKITQHHYHITGTWDEPKIQEISKR